MNIIHLYDYFKNSSGIVTDSRKVTQDSFFVALKGEKFDGNQYALEAIEKVMIQQSTVAVFVLS